MSKSTSKKIDIDTVVSNLEARVEEMSQEIGRLHAGWQKANMTIYRLEEEVESHQKFSAAQHDESVRLAEGWAESDIHILDLNEEIDVIQGQLDAALTTLHTVMTGG